MQTLNSWSIGSALISTGCSRWLAFIISALSVPRAWWQGDLEPDAGDVFEPRLSADQQAEDFPLVVVREVGVFDAGRDPALLCREEMRAQDLGPAPRLDKQVTLAFDDAGAGASSMQARNSGSIGSVRRLTRRPRCRSNCLMLFAGP